MTLLAGQRPSPAVLADEFRMQVPGGRRRITNDTATSGTTERVFIDTGTVALLANSTYEIRVELLWTGSTINDNFVLRLRDTNVSGTQRVIAVTHNVHTGSGGPYLTAFSYIHVTTAADSRVWAATIARLTGSGTGQALIGTMIRPFRLGADSLMSTV